MDDFKITEENFHEKALRFNDRQAGISLVYDPDDDSYMYNVYCIETKLLKDLFGCEYEFLTDALDVLHSEFGTWEDFSLAEKKSSCGTCVAKK